MAPPRPSSEAELGRDAGRVAAGRLAQRLRGGDHVAHVVGHLVGLAQAQRRRRATAPGRRRPPARRLRCRRRTASRSWRGGRPPATPAARTPRPGRRRCRWARRRARPAMVISGASSALRRRLGRLGQRLEGQHDQRVAGQHRDALAEGGMHRGHAAPRGGVVEAGQVVVHQRGAVQQLDGRRPRHRTAPGAASPQAPATARHSCGRMRAPPGNTAWRIAAASCGGPSGPSPSASARCSACSMRWRHRRSPGRGWRLRRAPDGGACVTFVCHS